MKRLIIVVLLAAGISNLHAQIGFGLRGGLNFSSLPTNTYQVDVYELEALPDSYTGWHIGVLSQLHFAGFFVQPELLFVATGNHMRLREENQEDFFFTQRFSKIDLPVMVGSKIGPLRIGIGPVASFLLHSSSELDDEDRFRALDIRENFNAATFGFQVGAGLDLSNILIDFKYEGNLSKLGNGIEVRGSNYAFDTRPRQFILSIGLLF